MDKKKAVVLLSGGLDSAVTLFLALEKGYRCLPLVFDYGQRHRREIDSAKEIAAAVPDPCCVMKIALPWSGSSLLDKGSDVSSAVAHKDSAARGVPATYVPARNMIFSSFAVSYAEASGAAAVFIGANAIDFSGYPDCTPGFFRAFDEAARQGTGAGARGEPVRILAPLLTKSKEDIVSIGARLGVPFGKTWSCYHGGSEPCGTCDSCRFRAKGFREAGLDDPLVPRAKEAA